MNMVLRSGAALAGLLAVLPAHAQMSQRAEWCAAVADRTDQPARDWANTYCTSRPVARAESVTPGAEQGRSGIVASISAGTLGIGPELTYRASENFGIRANAMFLGISRSVESDGVEYDGRLRLRSVGAMADLHPFGGGFRISAGARLNENRVRLEGTPTTNVEIGGTTYTPAQIGVLTGDVEANRFAPAATLGWGGGLTRGVKLGFEAGVLFQGRPRVSRLDATGSLRNDAAFRASLENERRLIEDDIRQFRFYPILQLSLGYRF